MPHTDATSQTPSLCEHPNRRDRGRASMRIPRPSVVQGSLPMAQLAIELAHLE